MGREFELKYQASAAVLDAIARQYPGLHRIEMETSYFDTPDGALSRQHMTLRLRRENTLSVCTLKTPLPDGSRGEWECTADTMEDGIARLLQLGAPAILRELTADGVQVSCGARFIRLAGAVATADGTAELALDRGVLLAGHRQAPLCEVEVELKTGSDEACLAFARALTADFDLQPQPESKFSRASALAIGE